MEGVGIGMSRVDEVTVVRQDEVGGVAVLRATLLEQGDALQRKRRCTPLALVFGKERKSSSANRCGVEWGVFYTAGGADVGAN